MSYEMKSGQGSLFKNDKKGNDKAPDYKGSANIDGVTMDVAAWVKRPEGKKPFLSLSIKKAQKSESQGPGSILSTDILGDL